MKHIYAVKNQEELHFLQSYVQSIEDKLSAYLEFLQETYAVTDLPRSIVWTDLETATQLISNIPIPAYTNEYRIVFCPYLDVWRSIYLHQLDSAEIPIVRDYYQTQLSANHILQILGHEFVHHSNLFIENSYEEYNQGIWFEEGMCEYISRKYFLSEEEFRGEAQINKLLAEAFCEKRGIHSLEAFGRTTYLENYAFIFYEYWRSFLAVEQLINAHNGDVCSVFRSYHQWNETKSQLTLEQWFGL